MPGLTWNHLFAALIPLLTGPAPAARLAAGLIGQAGAFHPAAARAAAGCLTGLIYADDAGVRAAGLRALAHVAAHYPLALGVPAWGWRVQVALTAAADPALALAGRRLLALCPAPIARVPAREAAIWAELARPVPVDQVA